MKGVIVGKNQFIGRDGCRTLSPLAENESTLGNKIPKKDNVRNNFKSITRQGVTFTSGKNANVLANGRRILGNSLFKKGQNTNIRAEQSVFYRNGSGAQQRDL